MVELWKIDTIKILINIIGYYFIQMRIESEIKWGINLIIFSQHFFSTKTYFITITFSIFLNVLEHKVETRDKAELESMALFRYVELFV